MLGLHSLVELANLTADTALTSPDPPPIDPRIADRFLFTVRQYGPGDFASSTDAPPEYLAYQRSQWWNSHRNAPALFVQANEIPGLWTDCQRSLIERYWPAGWQSDPSAPIMKLTGAMRPSSAHHREGAASEKMHRVSFLTEVATPYVMSDVNLRALPDIEPLAQGPMMLQRYSLLTRGSELEVKFRGTPMFLQDHRFLQMIIGSRGSYTAPHYDWFGMDAYLQLIEGEKIWWAAPPSSEPAFRRLFDDTNVNVTRQSKEASDQLQAMGGFAIHQRAGDMVFMPGGWIHCVKNLSYTVSFGGSYLRAWNLPLTIRYLTSTEKQNAHLINLSDVLDRLQTNDQKLTGIDDDEASMVRRIYEANKPRFHKYLRHASVEKYGTLLSIFAAASSQPSTSTTSSGRARTPTARARAATLVSSSRTKPSTASKRKKPDG